MCTPDHKTSTCQTIVCVKAGAEELDCPAQCSWALQPHCTPLRWSGTELTIAPVAEWPLIPTETLQHVVERLTEELHPHILHPAPYSLHSTTYYLHPTPYTLHYTLCSLLTTPCTLSFAHYSLQPTPYTLLPVPCTLHTAPYSLHPTLCSLHPTLCLRTLLCI